MLDIPTRIIPFIHHNDVIRVQMAATHSRQSIPIINAEVPFIRTGFEEQYLDYSSFLYRAKDSGTIIYKDHDLLIAKYDNIGNGEIINIDELHGNKEGFDKRLITNYNEGDTFNKDDILARHSTITNEGFLSLGRNLKTTYISTEYNFKDALVISESCAQKMSTTIIHEEIIDCTDTIPILWNDNNISYPQGTYITKATPIFVIKERNPKNPMHIVSRGEEILSPASGKLYYKIIVDEIVRTQNEEDYYSNIYKEEINREELIAQKIYEIYDIDNNERELLEANAYINYYCPQLHKHRSGKSIMLIYWIVEETPVIVGCKISNRHGNKGVISKIYPDKEMPRDKFGEYADVVVNSMNITSRMNVGQLFELHINRANYLYTSKVMNDNSLSIDDKIEKLYDMISNAQPNYINSIFRDFIDNSNQKEKFLKDVSKHNIVQIVHPPFTNFTYDDCLNFCVKYGSMDKSLKEPIIFDDNIIDASFGYQYWYRLEHEPNKKYFARSVGLKSIRSAA